MRADDRVKVGAVVAVAFVALALLAHGAPGPRIFPDEVIYMDAASSLAHGDGLSVRDGGYGYGPAYPILVAPLVALGGDRESAFALAQLLNALAFALVAVPVFLLARRVSGPRLALVASALAVLVPSSVYAARRRGARGHAARLGHAGAALGVADRRRPRAPRRRRPEPSVHVLAVLLAIAGSALAVAAPARAAAELPVRFPAAGELLRTAAAREAPDPAAPVVRSLRRFRPDRQFQIVLALGSRRGVDGAWWYRLSLPGRPNGARGWVRADAADVRPVRNRIVVRLAARTIEVLRIRDGRLLLRGVVAVGRPGAETPRGRDFYVQSAFVPLDPFYGAFALETSAYASVTDWPTDVVGIHGTDQPRLLGEAVSHGCIRVSNDVARRLGRLAPLGTPIDIAP